MYATLLAIRKLQREDQTALQTEQASLPQLASTVTTQVELQEASEQRLAVAREALKTETPKLQKVRTLDQRLSDMQQSISESESLSKLAVAKIDEDQQAKSAEENRLSLLARELKSVRDYLEQHEQDRWLITGLAGIEEQLKNLLARQNHIKQKQSELNKLRGMLTQAEHTLTQCCEQVNLHEAKHKQVSGQT